MLNPATVNENNVVLTSDGADAINPKEVIYVPTLGILGITMDTQDYNKYTKIETNGIYNVSGEELEFCTDIK